MREDRGGGITHYQLLQVSSSATQAEIKQAYRSLARRAHPDKGGDAALFARIQAAFEVLNDPKRRQVYDSCAWSMRWAGNRQPPAAAAGTPPAATAAASAAAAAAAATAASAAPHSRSTSSSSSNGGGGGGGGAPTFGPGDTESSPELDRRAAALLLAELASSGLQCDASTQLVVTCEACGRVATKQCWLCAMHICSFCTRRQHWKGDVPLHWPLVNSAHMVETLGRQQMERKRLEDARRWEEADPSFRSIAERMVLRNFLAAAAKAGLVDAAHARDYHHNHHDEGSSLSSSSSSALQTYQAQQQQARALAANAGSGSSSAPPPSSLPPPRRSCSYHYSLAKHYMWSQTNSHVSIAVYCPTGDVGREVVVECDAAGWLFVGTAPPRQPSLSSSATQGSSATAAAASGDVKGFLCLPEASAAAAAASGAGGSGAGGAAAAAPTTTLPPVIYRQLAYAPCASQPITTRRSGNNRLMVLALAKAQPGQRWARLFRGDSDGARLVPHQQPYTLFEGSSGAGGDDDSDVVLSFPVAFWTEPEDVKVSVTSTGVDVGVRNQLHVRRQFWTEHARLNQPSPAAARDSGAVTTPTAIKPGSAAPVHLLPCSVEGSGDRGDGGEGKAVAAVTVSTAAGASGTSSSGSGGSSAVVVEQCCWSLSSDDSGGSGGASGGTRASPLTRRKRSLMLTLVRPPLTQEEVTYKRGVRQDNRVMVRPPTWRLVTPQQRQVGAAFFMDDEDEFGLEQLLAASPAGGAAPPQQ